MFSKNDDYYKKQIITYLGNKRKFVGIIEKIIKDLEDKNKKKLSIGDGFSGSGIFHDQLFLEVQNLSPGASKLFLGRRG